MIRTTKIETPLGEMIAGATDDGVCLLGFSDGLSLTREYECLSKHLKTEVGEGENSYLTELRKELKEYFDGQRKEFNIPLVTVGSDFQKSVWKELLNIKYGKTRTYNEQAISMNNPLLIRAVANANGMNRIAIIIPCHRVIGSDGSLTGYAGGLHRKKWLLDHEKKHSGLPVDQSLF
jgi:AraC family transcriptional regulator, regulatory protein of adaptative response / methylated-DNA-[protein]-cysteine methyltransferase